MSLATVEEADVDLVWRGEATGALDVVDLVLLEETLDTLSEASDGSVLIWVSRTRGYDEANPPLPSS